MRALSQVKITFGAKVAIKSIGQEGRWTRTRGKRSETQAMDLSAAPHSQPTFPEISGATNLRGHYVPIVVSGIKHMGACVELYRIAKKAI